MNRTSACAYRALGCLDRNFDELVSCFYPEMTLRRCQVRSVPQLTGLREDTKDASVKQKSFSVFSAEGHREQFRHGQGRPVSDVIHRAFSSGDHDVAQPPDCPAG